MQRYFPVYAAILGVLALLLFLSPQIASFISADKVTQTRQILRGNDFKQTFDQSNWLDKKQNPSNEISTGKNLLRVNNTLSKDNYTLLAQRVSLRSDKVYEIRASYNWQNNKNIAGSASFGILKRGLTNPSAKIYTLENNSQDNEIVKYFKSDSTMADPYFYIFLPGSGSLEIKSLGLNELEALPASAVIDNQPDDQTLPITFENTDRALTGSNRPSPSSPTPAAKPDNNQPIKQKPGEILIYKGWSIISSEQDLSESTFSSQGLVAFQMLGGSWLKTSSPGELILDSNGAIYVYNPSGQVKSITPRFSETNAKLSKGWNLFPQNNFKNNELTINGQSVKISQLLAEKRISSIAYELNSTPTGVTEKKIDLASEEFDQSSAYWVYLLQ